MQNTDCVFRSHRRNTDDLDELPIVLKFHAYGLIDVPINVDPLNLWTHEDCLPFKYNWNGAVAANALCQFDV